MLCETDILIKTGYCPLNIYEICSRLLLSWFLNLPVNIIFSSGHLNSAVEIFRIVPNEKQSYWNYVCAKLVILAPHSFCFC
jgi:hypothetical protein